MKNHQFMLIHIVIMAALVLGIPGVRTARAETLDFGWAQRLGGIHLDYETAIAVDESGNVYTSGFYLDHDTGNHNAFITKWNGDHIWLYGMGGTSDEIAHAVALDGQGNVYAAGAYSGTVDFDGAGSTNPLTSAGLTDIFILKLKNEVELSFLWVKSLGGISSDSGYGMTVDGNGNIYVTGTYTDTVDFDPSDGVSHLTSAGQTDVFILKLDSDGNFLWARSIGGPGTDNSYDIAVDDNGNVFTTGYFNDTADFDPGDGTSNLTSLGLGDIFISKLSINGNFVWARREGAGSSDVGVEIALDKNGNAYMTGSYNDAGNDNILISKLDHLGNVLWTRIIGGTSFDAGYGIALDEVGNIYSTGQFADAVDFDPGDGTSILTSAGASDIFINKLDNDGNFLWAKNLGGTSNDLGEGIVVQNGDLFLTGAFSDTVDFDPGAGTNLLTSYADLDGFAARLTLAAQIHYVKWDASGANNGSSWEDAYTDLQSALAAASYGDEIWVAAGTYKPTSGIDRTLSFMLKNGVAVYGGFGGTEIVSTQRHPEANVTTLSGEIGVQGDNSDNSYHVVVGSGTNNSAILDGFTITGGNAENMNGGGMYINNGNPRLNQIIFTGNHAGLGGGLHVSHTGGYEITIDLELTNVVFRDNNASVEGGGMSAVFDPYPSAGSFGLSLTGVVFENNTAARTGGGLINNGPGLELVDVAFRGNTAVGGGGLSNLPQKPSTLTNVTFHNNSASEGGGGMLIGSSNSTLSTLTNVTFSNNSTDGNGGGIANAGYSDLLLTNVTFSENTAGASGGGISNGGFFIESGGTVNLINTTFSNNAANSSGGAIYNESGNTNIHNSILYGDTGGEIFDNPGTAVVTYSIVQGGYNGTGNLDADPLLGSLQNHGGFTQTMALGAGSPAIDSAEDTNCPNADQRGVARPKGNHCDRGAYEYDPSTVEISIGDTVVGSYLLESQESQRKNYPAVNGGPVRVVNLDDRSIMAAERVVYKVNNTPTSFSEMMGLPASQLDTIYWLPWYNNVDLDTQLRFANVSTSTATVHVYIGGDEMPGSPFTLPAGESTRKNFPGINKGPVNVVSDQSVVVAERVVYKVKGVNTSFSEMMALPNNQLDSTYWLPWYNNKDLDTQLRFANVSNSTATVHVYIADEEMPGSPFTLQAGESTRRSFPGVNNGPVKIVSDPGVPIVAAERVVYNVNNIPTSFSETMALPDNQIDTMYWFPWYNNATADLDTQLRFANVSNSTATVHVYVGGTEVPGSPFTLSAGESTRMSFPGVNNGPVNIVSDQKIVAAERVLYKVNGIPTSFSELMGLPNNLLDATFWFPWYNNVDLDTQLRFGIP